MRRYGQKGVSAGSDSVLVGFPVPKDSVLNYCKGEMHCMSSIVDAHDVAMYGLTGWLLRSDDEDSDFGDIQALWDAYVPKDDAGEAPDESVTGDTDEEVAIGNINVSEMFDIEMNGPERVWKREKMLTMAQAATGFHLTTTPAILFMPSDVVSIQVKKRYKAMQNAGLLFGFSSPNYASADNNLIPSVGTGDVVRGMEIMRYLSEHMDKAAIDFLGLIEAGAESPYTDILTFVINLMEGINVSSGTNGAFTAVTFDVSMKMTCGVKVPGHFQFGTLGPDMQA